MEYAQTENIHCLINFLETELLILIVSCVTVRLSDHWWSGHECRISSPAAGVEKVEIQMEWFRLYW